MGCVVSIPERVLVCLGRKELTPVSADVFVSIPKRVSNMLRMDSSHNQHIRFQWVLTYLTSQITLKLIGLTTIFGLAIFRPSG